MNIYIAKLAVIMLLCTHTFGGYKSDNFEYIWQLFTLSWPWHAAALACCQPWRASNPVDVSSFGDFRIWSPYVTELR